MSSLRRYYFLHNESSWVKYPDLESMEHGLAIWKEDAPHRNCSTFIFVEEESIQYLKRHIVRKELIIQDLQYKISVLQVAPASINTELQKQFDHTLLKVENQRKQIVKLEEEIATLKRVIKKVGA